MAASTPHNFRGNESSANLKVAGGPFSQFVAHKVRRDLWSFMNYLDTGSSDNMEGMGAGAPEFGEISTSSIGGVLIAASTDGYGQLWQLPSEIDLTADIKFRVLFSESGTGGSGSFLAAVTYKELVLGTTAVAIGATALSTAITATTPSTTANCLQGTVWGTLNGNTLTAGGQGENCVSLNVVGTLTTITDASMVALQCEYERRFVG